MMNNELFLKTLKSVLDKENEPLSNYANMTAIINEFFDELNWVGFYFVKNNSLYLGPFQGKVACTNIPYGKGVCGTTLAIKNTILVDDVHSFEGHIACDSASQSEIVIPIFKNDNIVALLDIDSPKLNRFTQNDKNILEEACHILESIL